MDHFLRIFHMKYIPELMVDIILIDSVNRNEIEKDGHAAFLFCCAGLSRQAQFELLPVTVS